MKNYSRGKSGGIIGSLLLILFIVKFYNPIFLLPLSWMYEGKKYIIIMTILTLFLLKWRQSHDDILFKKNIVYYLGFAVLNIITCYVFRDQPIWVSYWMWLPFFFILYYPILLKWNKSVLHWESVLVCLYIICCICLLSQYIFIDTQLFVLDTDFERLEYETRIRLYSDSIVYLGSLLCLNKYLVKKKSIFLFYWGLGVICIFIQGFRMLILCYCIIAIIMYARISKIQVKSIMSFAVIVLFVGFLMNSGRGQEKIEEMTERNETANFDNDDYVRVLLVDYYYKEHFINKLEMVLGSGFPHIVAKDPNTAESQYSKECSQRADMYHFYPFDMGLIGLSWDAGIPFTICFVVLLISIARTRVPSKEYLYIGAWELFIVMVGLTNEISYYHANIIYQAPVLVILTQLLNENGHNHWDKNRINKSEGYRLI